MKLIYEGDSILELIKMRISEHKRISIRYPTHIFLNRIEYEWLKIELKAETKMTKLTFQKDDGEDYEVAIHIVDGA